MCSNRLKMLELDWTAHQSPGLVLATSIRVVEVGGNCYRISPSSSSRVAVLRPCQDPTVICKNAVSGRIIETSLLHPSSTIRRANLQVPLRWTRAVAMMTDILLKFKSSSSDSCRHSGHKIDNQNATGLVALKKLDATESV